MEPWCPPAIEFTEAPCEVRRSSRKSQRLCPGSQAIGRPSEREVSLGEDGQQYGIFSLARLDRSLRFYARALEISRITAEDATRRECREMRRFGGTPAGDFPQLPLSRLPHEAPFALESPRGSALPLQCKKLTNSVAAPATVERFRPNGKGLIIPFQAFEKRTELPNRRSELSIQANCRSQRRESFRVLPRLPLSQPERAMPAWLIRLQRGGCGQEVDRFRNVSTPQQNHGQQGPAFRVGVNIDRPTGNVGCLVHPPLLDECAGDLIVNFPMVMLRLLLDEAEGLVKNSRGICVASLPREQATQVEQPVRIARSGSNRPFVELPCPVRIVVHLVRRSEKT